MALILRPGKIYTDSHGYKHSVGYAVIDDIVLKLSKNHSHLYFEVKIYDSLDMREAALHNLELSHYDSVPFMIDEPVIDGELYTFCYDHVYFKYNWCDDWESDLLDSD